MAHFTNCVFFIVIFILLNYIGDYMCVDACLFVLDVRLESEGTTLQEKQY